jgi:glycosyltransferase involved in cell wall biosynthesis
MIRVVHIIDHMGLGGVQTFLRTALPLLPRPRYEPMVVSLRGPTPLGEALRASGVPVVSLDLPRYSPRQLTSLVGLLRELRPAVAHTHLTVGKLVGRVAAVCAGVPQIVLDDQLSVSQDVYSLPPLVVLAYRLLEPSLARYTQLYLSPSHTVSQASRVAKRWPAERCRVLPNAVDCGRFAPAPDRAAQRRALGLPERVTIATFGRLVPQKRIDDVLRVAALVVPRFSDVQFLVAGSGPQEPRLRAQINAAGLNDHVRLLGFRRDTPELLAASDIYLSVSGGEALSVAILEALASGCAIVATSAGGTAEQVAPDVGALTAVGDVEGLATALLQLLENPRERQAMARSARQRALRHYDAPIIAAGLAAIYDELLAGAPAPAPLTG